MNLEGIMLSEISQTQKDKYCRILTYIGRIVKFMETESRIVVNKAWAGGGRKG